MVRIGVTLADKWVVAEEAKVEVEAVSNMMAKRTREVASIPMPKEDLKDRCLSSNTCSNNKTCQQCNSSPWS